MTENKEYIHAIEFGVRDYECDIQGVVNNANYQHYLEHARHEFLISRDISFSALHNEGIDLIVSRIEINYKYPLRSHDKFVVKSVIQKEGNVKLVFIRTFGPDEGRCTGRVACAAVKNGKPIRPEAIFEKLKLT